ncbi:protein kinase [bacterium]|nr:protein kinase [bacterium]
MLGKTISHYKILEKLGEGGMGVVYRAQDLSLDRPVALKFLPVQLTQDGQARERFEREARAAARLNHSNIIIIYEIAEFSGQIYMAMEYVEGETLEQRVKSGPLLFGQAVEFAVALADALSLAHRRGIVHRDIKPGNIMLCAEEHRKAGGQLKLLDFGLAQLQGVSKLTQDGTMAGTLAYMSPEQAQGREADHRSDIFSFGAVFYEMLTGSPPFSGEYAAAVLYSIVNEEPPLLSRQRAGIPNELERIVAKTMAKKTEQRYQSMCEVLADLAGYQYRPQTLLEKTGAEKKSIAVLPFEDISPGKQNEFLADGMSEELILALSQNRQLRVIARTSVMQYKGQVKDVRDVGRELGVSHVLEGSVRRHEARLRVTAQLIDATDGTHLWADKFDGVMEDIFSFQEHVADQVTTALKVQLGQMDIEMPAKKPPQPAAYEYYLKGKLLQDAPTLQNLDNSVLMLQRALQLDDSYAAAYGSLSGAYLWYIDTGLRPDPGYLAKAETVAHKALSLDANQTDALYTLANLKMKRGDIEGAVAQFTKVLQTDPNHRNTLLWRTVLIYMSSYLERALQEADRLLAIDPFWPMAHWLHSTIRLHQGMFDAAMAEYEQMISEVPSKLVWLALAYRYVGSLEKARQAAHKLKELEPDGILWPIAFAFIEGAEGKSKKILEYVDERIKAFAWDFYIATYWVASFYAIAGEKDEAFRWLERAVEIGNRNYRWFAVDPNLANVQDDPRFAGFMIKARNEAMKLESFI